MKILVINEPLREAPQFPRKPQYVACILFLYVLVNHLDVYKRQIIIMTKILYTCVKVMYVNSNL